MSAPEESLNGQDPDYVSATSNDQVQQKIYEENGKHIVSVKNDFSQNWHMYMNKKMEIEIFKLRRQY